MTRGVKYISSAEISGYGLTALPTMQALAGAGVPVTWHPMIFTNGNYRPAANVEQVVAAMGAVPDIEDLSAFFRAPVDYDTIIVHKTPEHWPQAIEPGKRMVGYTMWETDRLPPRWPECFEGYDLIMVPSSFCVDLFAPHARSPVVVIPPFPRTNGLRTDSGSVALFRRRFAIEEDDFVFYTINTWILRKAMWLTLHAFLLTFTAGERAVLVVKTGPFGEAEGGGYGPSRRWYDRILSNYPEPARVLFVPDELSEEDIGRLHLAGDAFVSLTHGEGFGIGAFDAAAAGNPVIMTGWSGPLDFLPAEHACLVEYELRQVTDLRGKPSPDQRWAYADLDQAIAWMRHLYENPGEARSRGARLKAHVEQHFDPASITRRLLDALHG